MINDDIRILVLCTGNSCRSQMAEGFFRHYLKKAGLVSAAANVRSAGLETHGVNPIAVQVMAEIGLDISDHTSDNLEMYLGEDWDYVITVCDNAAARCPVFPGKAIRLHWPFPDPALATGSDDKVLNEFRQVRDEIARQVTGWLQDL